MEPLSWGLDTTQRVEQISSCIISSSICSRLPQKGLPQATEATKQAWVRAGAERRGRGGGGGVPEAGRRCRCRCLATWLSSSLPLSPPLGTQLAAQALFINQIKFIWPPQQSYAPSPTPPYLTPLHSFAHSLPAPFQRGTSRGGGGQAGSRRCQLPIS